MNVYVCLCIHHFFGFILCYFLQTRQDSVVTLKQSYQTSYRSLLFCFVLTYLRGAVYLKKT